MTTLIESLEALATVKEQIAQLTKRKGEIEAEAIEKMDKAKVKTTETPSGVKATIVRGSTITIDPDALKRALTPAQWKKVTKQVLDKEALEAHIVTKDIDANVVAAASTEKDSKPYIRVTGKIATPVPVAGPVTTSSSGATKPAAKKRVVRPKKP